MGTVGEGREGDRVSILYVNGCKRIQQSIRTAYGSICGDRTSPTGKQIYPKQLEKYK